MKKILIIALSLMLPLCTIAQKKGFKLVEKSGEKPEWVGMGSVKGFIIVQSDKPTLEEVKARKEVHGKLTSCSYYASSQGMAFNLFSLEVSDLYRWEMNSAPIY